MPLGQVHGLPIALLRLLRANLCCRMSDTTSGLTLLATDAPFFRPRPQGAWANRGGALGRNLPLQSARRGAPGFEPRRWGRKKLGSPPPGRRHAVVHALQLAHGPESTPGPLCLLSQKVGVSEDHVPWPRMLRARRQGARWNARPFSRSLSEAHPVDLWKLWWLSSPSTNHLCTYAIHRPAAVPNPVTLGAESLPLFCIHRGYT